MPTYINNLLPELWSSVDSSAKIIYPEVKEADYMTCQPGGVAYTFSLSSINAHIPYDSFNWVLCGLRITSSEGMSPPAGDMVQPYSVLLGINNTQLFGIPGDFTMAYEGQWSTFTWPLPINLIRNLRPSVRLQYYPNTPRLRPPIVELYVRQVDDISDYNYIFVISNNLSSIDRVRHTVLYHRDAGLFPMEYFTECVPGPFKAIPSWSLIRRGWRDTQMCHSSMDIDTFKYNINYMWIDDDDRRHHTSV